MLARLPSPFYRVTAKALIRDSDGRLLLVKNKHGQWELPGGGWEHDEDFAEALAREIHEELGVSTLSVGDITCTYRRDHERRGFMVLRLVAPVTIENRSFTTGPDILGYEWVTREQFEGLDLAAAEGDVAGCVDIIWPEFAELRAAAPSS